MKHFMGLAVALAFVAAPVFAGNDEAKAPAVAQGKAVHHHHQQQVAPVKPAPKTGPVQQQPVPPKKNG